MNYLNEYDSITTFTYIDVKLFKRNMTPILYFKNNLPTKLFTILSK